MPWGDSRRFDFPGTAGVPAGGPSRAQTVSPPTSPTSILRPIQIPAGDEPAAKPRPLLPTVLSGAPRGAPFYFPAVFPDSPRYSLLAKKRQLDKPDLPEGTC